MKTKRKRDAVIAVPMGIPMNIKDDIDFTHLRRLPWSTLSEYTTAPLDEMPKVAYCARHGCKCTCSSTMACVKHHRLPAFAMFQTMSPGADCRYCRADREAQRQRRRQRLPMEDLAGARTT